MCALKGGKGNERSGVCWYEFPRAGPPDRTEACRIRVPCICNEGCAPPTRRWQCRCARCIKAQPMADYRRSRAREQQFYAPRYLSSPGHWNAIPRADDLYLANARPRGRMSHVPSLCLYRSPSKISRSAEARYAWHVRTSTIGATIRLRIESERSTLKNLGLESYTGFFWHFFFSFPFFGENLRDGNLFGDDNLKRIERSVFVIAFTRRCWKWKDNLMWWADKIFNNGFLASSCRSVNFKMDIIFACINKSIYFLLVSVAINE